MRVPIGPARRRPALAGGAALLALAATLAPAARAAGPPVPGATWAGEVAAGSARLHSSVNPNGLFTAYRFDYITGAAYEANLSAGHEGFLGARSAPAGAEAPLGSGTTAIAVSQQLSGLEPETAYRYRLVAQNSAGTARDPESGSLGLIAQGLGGASLPADGRGWEMVSPVDKNGGAVAAPGQIFGGGVLQAAAGGGAVTYSSTASFGAGAQERRPPASTSPAAAKAAGRPRTSPRRCRPAPTAPNPKAPPTGSSPKTSRGRSCSTRAAAGRRTLPALLLAAGRGGESRELPEAPGLRFEGADPGLRHVVLGSAEGLYEWGEGSLDPLSPAPGARLAAPAGAVSGDGARVYFALGGDLYLREGAQTKQVDAAVGGGGSFQAATPERRHRPLHQGRPPLPLPRRRRGAEHRPHPRRRGGGSARHLRRGRLRLLPGRRRAEALARGDDEHGRGGRRSHAAKRLPAGRRHGAGLSRRHPPRLPLRRASQRL